MNSIILRTATVFILPLLLMFSVIVLLRGHNEPGGGFVGGLLGSAAFILYLLAADHRSARSLLRIPPLTIAGIGLLLALVSGLLSVFASKPPFEALWTDIVVLREVKIGTPLLFDIGVYFTVVGVVLTIAFTMSESADDSSRALEPHISEQGEPR
jgi:multicomponent Na+:H+ antiporter subunit B